MTDRIPLTDNERLRAFAQSLIDDADHVVDECGVVGGRLEVERAEVARKLITLLDTLPPPTAYERIPPLVLEGLLRYGSQDVRPGGFLASVLANDLAGAITRGDPDSVMALPAIVAWCKAELPGYAWGSHGQVDAWCRRARS